MELLNQVFKSRHIGPTAEDQTYMLSFLGVSSINELVEQVVPQHILDKNLNELPVAQAEAQALKELKVLADKNQSYESYIGQGYYRSILPGVIGRNILENPAWYTSYTPYQAEISQGRLEALLNFQTMVSDLTGLPIANASLLDEGTAAAEAMMLSKRSVRQASNYFFVSQYLHPQTIQVIKTRARYLGIQCVIGDEFKEDLSQCFAAIVQYPRTLGEIVDYQPLADRLHAQKSQLIVAADPLSLMLLKSPAEFGADIVVGTTQRFGLPLSFGGPHAAYLACKEELRRHIPGRLIGVSKDSQGQQALRLALQTREQHIRREKATSNICTAQALLAIISSMYAIYHGQKGLNRIAQYVHQMTQLFAQGAKAHGLTPEYSTFFDTLYFKTNQAQMYIQRARQKGMNVRVLSDGFAVSFDETSDVESVNRLLSALFDKTIHQEEITQEVAFKAFARTDKALKHSIFYKISSETHMLRYIRSLSDKDLALDRTMIPLGSCTMKLNATSQMVPITWDRFMDVHPFAPSEQTQGYQEMIRRLSQYLCHITGYDALSVQPNSGAQGEYAGLLTIRAYYESIGQSYRDVCLIPASAHGTNPASAQMAGLQVRVVATDAKGNVDLEDLDKHLNEIGNRLAVLMITYPSTHGVFEESIVEICDKVHAVGGQIYLDGANMNAMVGLAKPGLFGSDVSHLNLHKTFAVPHGGGGPGAGPIGVKSHLAPFLPGAYDEQGNLVGQVGSVSSSTYGSANILPIAYMYIRLLGSEGLRQATQGALLNANYIASRLAPYYPILYVGKNGRVAHECILDIRPIKERTGITVDDIAKRLIDFGLHAPTMSFPVVGTLMVEPTESEDLDELERFINAMIQIKAEIDAVESGEFDAVDNPLKNAPHTAQSLVADSWEHKYTRQQAAYPKGVNPVLKYWSPVGRVDNAYGDRHLICICPSIDEYQSSI